MQNMLKQAQKMQEEMAEKQAELEEREYTAASGGGAVTAVVDGAHTLLSLSIKPEVADPEDTEMLADLVMAAVNQAIRKAIDTSEEELGKISGGMGIPGMPGLF